MPSVIAGEASGNNIAASICTAILPSDEMLRGRLSHRLEAMEAESALIATGGATQELKT
jgi:hypothetical protein